MRIVTLAPALTQMVVDLGRGDLIVGVSDKDTAAPAAVPVVGNYVELDTERLVAAQPSHVLQMVSKEGLPTSLRGLAEAAGFEVVGYAYPNSIADVADILHAEEPSRSGPPDLGRLLAQHRGAELLRSAFLGFFTDLERITSKAGKPRVLLAIGTGPLMASGPGTVNDELLRYAGGVNAAADATVTAPTFDREALLAMNPQVVLVLSPGREGADAEAMATLLPELAQLPIEAVERDRVVLINDPATLLPSTSLPRIAAIMAAALHPELAAEIGGLRERYDALVEEARRARTQR